MNATATTDAAILRYQSGRSFDSVSGYGAGCQLHLGDGRRVYLALSSTELVAYFDQGLALHYDLEGRLVKRTAHDNYHRRGLSHRTLHTRKRTTEEGGGLARSIVSAAASDEMVASTNALIREIYDAWQAGTAVTEFAKPSPELAAMSVGKTLAKAARFDERAARADAERFHEVYSRMGVLPPDQYNALLLQATEGCAYLGCLFCELYQGEMYRRKTAEEFRRHVATAVAYHGDGLRARRSIFLGEANALATPQETLRQYFEILNEQFELPRPEQEHVPARWWLGSRSRFDGVSSFVDVFGGAPQTSEDFSALRTLGLRRVYIGMETGSNALLRWLCKPATADKIRRTVQAVQEAGIAVGVIVLLGAGGREFDVVHTKATAALVNELQLGAGDYVYFSPLLIQCGSRYAEQTKALDMEPLSPREMDGQEQNIRDTLRFDARRGRPYIARYALETFLY